MASDRRVLIVDDDRQIREVLRADLPPPATTAASRPDGRERRGQLRGGAAAAHHDRPQDAGHGRPRAPPAGARGRRRRRGDHAHRRRRRADRGREPQARRLRLHPEAGRTWTSCSSRPSGRSSAASSSSSAASTTPCSRTACRGHPRSGRAPIASWSPPTGATLEALGSALDTRDVGTEAHSRRVHGYSLATARAHGVPEADLRDLAHGVLLHDIGKIGIPDAILLKPGPLTPEEWKVMRTHPEIGRRDHREDPVPARRDSDRLPPPRAVGRHRVPARASRAKRSRSARGSSRWRTPSTR